MFIVCDWSKDSCFWTVILNMNWIALIDICTYSANFLRFFNNGSRQWSVSDNWVKTTSFFVNSLTVYIVFLNLLTSQFLLVISANSSPWLPCRLLEGVGSSLHNSVSRSTSTKFRSLICETKKKMIITTLNDGFQVKKTTQIVIVFNILLVFSATALTYISYECHNILTTK